MTKTVKFTIEAIIFTDESEIDSVRESLDDLIYENFDSTNIKIKSRIVVSEEDEEDEELE